MKSVDVPLHDIAPLLEVREYSLYWFILLVIAVFVSILLLRHQMSTKKTPMVKSQRHMKYEKLTRINMNDSKAAAYAISEQALFFAQESDEIRAMYRSLFERLERYKYAPVVEAIDEETLDLYRLFLQKISI